MKAKRNSFIIQIQNLITMQLWKCYQAKQAMAKAQANSNGKQKYGLLGFGLNKRSVQCYKSHAT